METRSAAQVQAETPPQLEAEEGDNGSPAALLQLPGDVLQRVVWHLNWLGVAALALACRAGRAAVAHSPACTADPLIAAALWLLEGNKITRELLLNYCNATSPRDLSTLRGCRWLRAQARKQGMKLSMFQLGEQWYWRHKADDSDGEGDGESDGDRDGGRDGESNGESNSGGGGAAGGDEDDDNDGEDGGEEQSGSEGESAGEGGDDDEDWEGSQSGSDSSDDGPYTTCVMCYESYRSNGMYLSGSQGGLVCWECQVQDGWVCEVEEATSASAMARLVAAFGSP